MKTERHLRPPPELDEGFPLTFARLRAMFRARGVHADEAADLASETIARTLLHLRRRGHMLDDGSRPDGLDPLMRRIATNLLIDRARALSPQLLPIEGAFDITDDRPDPSAEVERRQQRAQVHHAIGELASRHRTAMLLSLEGLTPAEIAEHLGIQRNAADALLYRARRSLARSLGALTGLIRGVAVIVALKLREAGRRAGEVARVGEQLVAGQTVLGLTAASLGAALSFSAPPVAPTTDVTSAPTRVEAATSSGTAAEDAFASTAVGSEQRTQTRSGVGSVRPVASVNGDDHRVKVGATVDEGEDEGGTDLELWHEEDDDDRGVAGPLLDEATGTACAAAPTCDL